MTRGDRILIALLAGSATFGLLVANFLFIRFAAGCP